jgi:hypothetical protein
MALFNYLIVTKVFEIYLKIESFPTHQSLLKENIFGVGIGKTLNYKLSQ